MGLFDDIRKKVDSLEESFKELQVITDEDGENPEPNYRMILDVYWPTIELVMKMRDRYAGPPLIIVPDTPEEVKELIIAINKAQSILNVRRT